MYTALTNSFDVLRSCNVALQDPISLPFVTCSTMPLCKDTLLPLCHRDMSPSCPTGLGSREPQVGCGWSREGSLPPSIGELLEESKKALLISLSASPFSVGAFCAEVLWAHNYPSAYTCAIEKWNEHWARPTEWTAIGLHLPCTRPINLTARQAVLVQEHISWHSPVTRVFLFDTRQCHWARHHS